MNDLNKNRVSGLTLIELMISVLIVGMLLGVAVPLYQKFSAKAKLSEGYTMLRAAYDSQVHFATIPHVFRNADGKDMECELPLKFSPFHGFFDMPDDTPRSTNGRGQLNWPPPGVKGRFLLWSVDSTDLVDVSCDFTYWSRYNFDEVGYAGALPFASLTEMDEAVWGDQGSFFAVTDGPTYFGLGATPDASLATAQGVPLENTLTVWAIADLDGDYTGTDKVLQTYPLGYSSIDRLTILGRGIFVNAKGDVVGVPGILKMNVGD